MTVYIEKRKSDKLDGARRLLDLDVREISLVDRPAIKREFVIIKRLADDGDTDAAALVGEFRKRFSMEEETAGDQVEKGSAAQNKLPDAAFAGISPSGKKDAQGKTVPRSKRHLPHHTGAVKSRTENTSIDKPLLRNALARANQVKASPALKARMLSHIRAHAKAVLPTSEAARKAIMGDEAILKSLSLEEHYDLAEVGVENLPSELLAQLQKVTDGLEAADVDGIDQAIGFLSTILKGKLPVPKGEEMTISNQELDAAQGGDNVEKNTPPATEPQANTPAAADAQATPQNAETPQGEQVERTKVVDPKDDGPAPAIQVFEDGSVRIGGQTVAKGRTFTQDRINLLVGNMEQLAGLMKDVAPEELAALVDKLSAELPTNPKFRGAVQATPTPGPKKDKPRRGRMMKDANGNEVEVFEDDETDVAALTKTVETLKAELETIKKARSPSTSVGEDGGTDDPQNVEKTAPGSSGFWSGTLF